MRTAKFDVQYVGMKNRVELEELFVGRGE
jgi:hypothetical protein